MKISGLQKTTLLDYPGHVAATIFLGGCNFRCPFCHNMNIVDPTAYDGDESSQQVDFYTENDVISFLKKRAGVLDGVCITGGEPTLHGDLESFIKAIKNIEKPSGEKYLIKLDTNGTNPDLIKRLIDEKLIDYVAMDIKASEAMYKTVAGLEDGICANYGIDISVGDNLIDNIKKSVNLIMTSAARYEFRTTVVKEYHSLEVMMGIGELIKGAKNYYIQSYVDSEYVPNHNLHAIDKDILMEYSEIMKRYVDNVIVRGVD